MQTRVNSKLSTPGIAKMQILALVLLLFALSPTIKGEVVAMEPLRVRIPEQFEPEYPYSMKMRGVEQGTTKILLLVGEDSLLKDYIILEASHSELMDPIREVIENWEFIIDPEMNTSVTHTLELFMANSGGVHMITPMLDMSNFMARGTHAYDTPYKLPTARDLDDMPRPIDIVRPLIAEVDRVSFEGEKVVFSFFVDETGNVRIPALEKAPEGLSIETLLSIQGALLQWKFATPTVDEHPVKVKLAQAFLLQ